MKELDEEIEQVKVKQDDLRTRISGGGSNSSVNEERQKIRAELNSLKDA